jgi:hypothetical protein
MARWRVKRCGRNRRPTWTSGRRAGCSRWSARRLPGSLLAAPDKRLPCPSPYDAGIARVQCQRADGRDVLGIKDRLPMDVTVGGLEDAAGGGADVVDPGIARNPDHCSGAVAHRPNVTIFQLAVSLRRERRLRLKRDRKGEQQQPKHACGRLCHDGLRGETSPSQNRANSSLVKTAKSTADFHLCSTQLGRIVLPVKDERLPIS